MPSPAGRRLAAALLAAAAIVAACGPEVVAPPSFRPGTQAAPRAVNLIAVDYAFVPSPFVVVPGETVLVHLVNGGLAPHEAVIGDGAVQAAWEAAEAATANHPPGPTPQVSVPPEVAGIRVFVASGQRVDFVWSVPETAGAPSPSSSAATPWFIGCHIPGHYAKGMVVAIRFISSEEAAAGAPAPP